jgi:predicted cation transporter
MAAVELTIPEEPNLLIVLGLIIILVLVLILPFRVKKIEENLEPFFLVMGIIAVTISNLWSIDLIIEAIEAPVKISEVYGIPIGIFQVVLIVGLIIHYYNKPIYSALVTLMKKIGVRTFALIFVVLFGLASSLISVIVCAVLLAEIALVMPLERKKKVEFIVIACFAVGFGAALTPVGEPLSTIAVKKLAGEPYHADFFFLFNILAHYIIPAVILLGILAVLRVGKQSTENIGIPEYTETLRGVIVRALKVYAFVAALILLGGGFNPLIVWYISKIPPEILYWVNMVSAVLDNATLTAAEIGPSLTLDQIQSALMALLISGGMLIPGNIPNIVSAARLKITSSEWAKVGVPLGLVLMGAYYVIIFFLGL